MFSSKGLFLPSKNQGAAFIMLFCTLSWLMDVHGINLFPSFKFVMIRSMWRGQKHLSCQATYLKATWSAPDNQLETAFFLSRSDGYVKYGDAMLKALTALNESTSFAWVLLVSSNKCRFFLKIMANRSLISLTLVVWHNGVVHVVMRQMNASLAQRIALSTFSQEMFCRWIILSLIF